MHKSDEIEENERKIIEDLSHQLTFQSIEVQSLNLELERYKEENRLQYEEIILLKKRLLETELKLHQLTSENDGTSSILSITKENQDLLAIELAEFKSRYAEALVLLNETQERLRHQRKKSLPSVRGSFIPLANPYFVTDSLQSELYDSLDSGILSNNGMNKKTYQGVCDTIKCVKNSGKDSSFDGMSHATSTPRISSDFNPFQTSIYGFPREINTIKDDTENYGSSQTGVPGCPGAKDLEDALMRITPADILSRRSMLSHSQFGTYSYDEHSFTPGSVFSTISAETITHWKTPKKLEIVKPFEGSETLQCWSNLAKPTMGGLLHENERIKVRGEKPLNDITMHMQTSVLEGKIFNQKLERKIYFLVN